MTTHTSFLWKHNGGIALAKDILHKLFLHYRGSFSVQLWNDSVFQIGKGLPAFTLIIKHKSVLFHLVWFRDPIRLAESYFNGDVEVFGDFNQAMRLRYYLEGLRLPVQKKIQLLVNSILLGIQRQSSSKKQSVMNRVLDIYRHNSMRNNDVESIAFHYDVSNAFYKLWLDERMVYSCAYFEDKTQDLNLAQSNKLDYICRKLRLKPGDNYLDIGCGWGALICWAAKHYGVSAHGITLSKNQYEYVVEEVKRQGLENKVTVELRDFRDLPQVETYDKVSSIGMFEHVGLRNLASYFSVVHGVLKSGGLFLNHGITTDEPDWESSVSTRFINRHVFPNGELDTISNIQCRMEEADFEIFDLEGLRPHYALTLRHWVHRLEENHYEAISLVGERIYRTWRLYMTGCAIQFEQGETGVYQILAERKHSGMPHLPLTRRDLYTRRNKN